MKKKRIVALCGLLLCMLCGCQKKEVVDASANDTSAAIEQELAETAEKIDKMTEMSAKGKEIDSQEASVSENESVSVNEPELIAKEDCREEPIEMLQFVDVFGEAYETEINPAVSKHSYDKSAFVNQDGRMKYDGADFQSKLGVDVSHHQGKIDWAAVKQAGIDFAFLRIGYRGYGEEGTVNLDREFAANIQGAQAAGIDVGVYFYAQAINEAEAQEEAAFVVEHLAPYQLQLPVVYDPESVLDAKARTDNVTGEQFTKNTRAFCDYIRKSGYEPMVYANMLWEAYELDLSQLSDIEIWYADYESKPQTPYHFAIWQYTNEGHIAGISGRVDLNVWLY